MAVQAGPLFTRPPRSGHIRAHHRRHHGAPDVADLLLVRRPRTLRRRSLHRRVRRLCHRPDHRRHRDLLVPLRAGSHRSRHRRRRPRRHDPRVDPRIRRLAPPRPHPAHARHAGNRHRCHGSNLPPPQSRHRDIADHAGPPGRHVPPALPVDGHRPRARRVGRRLHGDLRVQQCGLRHPARRPLPPRHRLVDAHPHHPGHHRGSHRLPRHHGRRQEPAHTPALAAPHQTHPVDLPDSRVRGRARPRAHRVEQPRDPGRDRHSLQDPQRHARRRELPLIRPVRPRRWRHAAPDPLHAGHPHDDRRRLRIHCGRREGHNFCRSRLGRHR